MYYVPYQPVRQMDTFKKTFWIYFSWNILAVSNYLFRKTPNVSRAIRDNKSFSHSQKKYIPKNFGESEYILTLQKLFGCIKAKLLHIIDQSQILQGKESILDF